MNFELSTFQTWTLLITLWGTLILGASLMRDRDK